MHPELVRRFHEPIRDEAARRYGLSPEQLTELAAFENFVYEAENDDGEGIILRISHSTRRTIDYTLGEVEFVRYLAAARIPIASPVLSDSGQFVERIEDREPGSYFVATAFERAPGIVFDDAPPLKERYWKPPLFRDMGRLFARLHNRAQTYVPSSPRLKRQEWHEYDVVDINRFAPPEEKLVRERTAAIIARLNQLPRTPESYGLIHADLHMHNFCFAEGKITAFDFDNCEYAWFVKDIAVLLFYIARGEAKEAREEAVTAFLGPFLEGYRELRPMEREWLAAVPDLLALQRSMNYALFHQYRDPAVLDESTLDRWGRFRRDIEADTPVLQIDFTRF
ncbi:phosphotransferase enzyme family protein [Corallococcus interemptor]|uniref:phosphotransferase enzyme family protein n=1 Tax=Corallococcus interemptor TaxID=2316720 RepID=UPI003D05E21A